MLLGLDNQSRQPCEVGVVYIITELGVLGKEILKHKAPPSKGLKLAHFGLKILLSVEPLLP